MSEYVREVIVKRRFQGDDVTVVLKPINFADMLKFGDMDIKALKRNDLASIAADMKPYVVRMTGLKTKDASDVTVDELFEAAFFLELLTEVLGEWIEKALPANPTSAGASLNA